MRINYINLRINRIEIADNKGSDVFQINEAIGNVQLMQKINRLKVLNYIRQHSGVIRPEIAKNTEFEPVFCTNIVSRIFLEKKAL